MTPARRAEIAALRAGMPKLPPFNGDYVQQARSFMRLDPALIHQFLATAPAAIDDLTAENAELRALLQAVTREHEADCTFTAYGEGCDCGVEADRVQVRGLLAQEGPN